MLRWLMRIRFDEVFAALGLLAIVLLIFANVIGRYVLPVAWAFTEELTCAMVIIVSLWGAAVAARRGQFLGLDLLADHFSGTAKKWILSLQPISIFIFSSLLVVYGIEMVLSEIKYGIRTTTLGWPEAVFGSFIPIGAVFVLLGAIQRMIVIWADTRTYTPEQGQKESV